METENSFDKIVPKCDNPTGIMETRNVADRQTMKRDRKRSRKRRYIFAFGQKKKKRSFNCRSEEITACRAKDTIIIITSIADQLYESSRTSLTYSPKETMDYQNLDTKRTKVCLTLYPMVQEGRNRPHLSEMHLSEVVDERRTLANPQNSE